MAYREDSGILYEQLVNKLERQIAAGVLRQGDKLPSENTLAQENNVSRVTVRQALKLLAEMGLIETRKGIGSFVIVDSDPKQVNKKVNDFLRRFEDNFHQAMQAKILIEPSIAKYAAEKASENAVAKMESLLEQMKSASGRKRYNELCITFHLALIETAENPLLLDFYRKLEEMEQMYLRDLLLPHDKSRQLRIQDIEQHGKILRAVKERRSDMAYLYCLEHLEYFYNYYKDSQKKL